VQPMWTNVCLALARIMRRAWTVWTATAARAVQVRVREAASALGHGFASNRVVRGSAVVVWFGSCAYMCVCVCVSRCE
jgi:hypothetical protein